MSEENNAPTGQTVEPTAKTEKPNNIEALERKNRELLAKLKSEKEKREEFSSRLDKIEQEKLESQGKYQDINKSLKERLEQIEKEKRETENKFKFNAINSSLKQAALQAGCKKPEAVLKLLEREEKEMIQIDDSYTVDNESINPVLDRIKQEYPMLFEKSSTPVKDISPSREPIRQEPKEMTEEQILEQYISKGLNNYESKGEPEEEIVEP